jgi:hypothetical protein
MSPHSAFLSPIEDVIEDARQGRMFILVDDEGRENEGDLVIPAEKADADAVNFMAKYGRGLICLSITRQRTQQLGLQMGPELWHEFIEPELVRMYSVVRAAGKFVFIHSCGDVDELFESLIKDGVSCFNPFQPEVMDVAALIPRYHGRLAFHGGLSTQRTLPYGTTTDVRNETARLLELGRNGGYILSPAHSVEGDVPLANMLAFIDEAMAQPGFKP